MRDEGVDRVVAGFDERLNPDGYREKVESRLGAGFDEGKSGTIGMRVALGDSGL